MILIRDPGRITPHFKGAEFRCPCGCGRIFISEELVLFLEEARSYHDTPLLVNSGYRCPVHNASLEGAAPRSFHTMGLAADVRFARGGTASYALYFAKHWGTRRGGLIIYPTFFHLDQGPPRILDRRTEPDRRLTT